MSLSKSTASENQEKKNLLYLILASIFLSNALLAEIIGTKLFSLEGTLGLPEMKLPLFGGVYNFDLTAGVLLWPVVFLTTDVINEYFGKKGVRRITFITVGCILYSFFVFWGVSRLAPSKFWVDLYAERGLDIELAFNQIFLQSMGIVVGSLTAFLIGQLLDAYVFHWFKSVTGGKMIWLRATGSTLVSQLVDSFVVLYIAFYIFGGYELSFVLGVGLKNYLYKFAVALLLTPVIYLAHSWIDHYLGKGLSEKLEKEADQSY